MTMSTPYESFSDEVEERNHRFAAVLFKFSNAVLAFFYEAESIKLGTLAIAMPRFEGGGCISSILLGERNMVITKILAEHISNTFKGMALVSTHLAEISETETSKTLFKLTKKLLEKTGLK